MIFYRVFALWNGKEKSQLLQPEAGNIKFAVPFWICVFTGRLGGRFMTEEENRITLMQSIYHSVGRCFF